MQSPQSKSANALIALALFGPAGWAREGRWLKRLLLEQTFKVAAP